MSRLRRLSLHLHPLLQLLLQLLFVLLILLTPGSQAQRGAIPIGAIFDVSDHTSRAAFEATVKENRNHEKRVPYYDFNVTVDSVDISNNFQLASAICRQMSMGVFAILGQKSMGSSDIVKAFTSTFHMPFVTPSLSRMAMREHSPFELHMKPDHTEALVDVIRHFKWEAVHFLYDSDEGMQRLQRIFRAMKNETVEWFAVKRLSDVTQVHEDLRHIDRVEMGINKCFVLDLSSEEAYNLVLKQIPEVGMNKLGYYYLLGTLDFLNLNLSRFRHGGVNVTGFQLMAEDHNMEDGYIRDAMDNGQGEGQQYIPIRAALAVDGLGVIEDAVAELVRHDPDIFRYMFRRGEVYNNNRTKGIPCSTRPPEPWMHGNKLMKIMKESKSQGFSGTLQFSEDSYRSNYSLGLYSAGMGMEVQKIGTWATDQGFRSVFAKDSARKKIRPRVSRHNTTRIVTTILSEPFLMLKECDADGCPLVGKDKYEGYCVDLANKLSRLIGFEFEFRLVADNAFGVRNEEGRWNGMMGELIDGIADMAIAPLTITADRERVVDFSKPFMDVGISIMIKKPEKQKPGVFSFMQPLCIEIWVCIIIGYTVISVGLFLVSRFSPVEWRKIELPHGPTFQNEFSLQNSLWFSMGALMFQGSESCPRSLPGRIIGGVWWFFVLIIISSYTANLAAFLTIERMVSPVESADDLAKQTDIKYGTLKAGTTMEFFKKSDVPTYMQMWEFMTANPDTFVATTAEGIERVRNSKGKYAFLLESSNNDYHQNRKPCNTMRVGPNLNAKSFGIATPQGSDLKDVITLGVLTLKEDGTLHQLKTKWWFEKGQCSSESEAKDSKKRPLSLSNVAGIFYILIGGLVLSIILGVFEFMCSRRKNPQRLVLRTTDTSTTLAGTPVDRELTTPFRDSAHSENFNSSKNYHTDYSMDGATPRLIGFEAFQDGHPHTDV